MRPNLFEIPGRRWLAYVLVSLLSGIGWAGISLIWFGRNGSLHAEVPTLYLLFSGAISGLLVGLAMNWFYRSRSWVSLLLSAPLAYYLGALFYLTQIVLYNPPPPPNIVPVHLLALLVFLPPFVVLMVLAWLNGLLLRWILLGPPSLNN